MSETLFHLGFEPGRAHAEYAILPGDPGRVSAIAAHLDGALELGNSREYLSMQGMLAGRPVIVCSTGIGGPSAAIAVEELFMAGVHTFIRVGTCGGMQLNVAPGDIVIASSATRNDGTSNQYAPKSYPASASFDCTAALKQAADRLGYPNHVGVVHSKDSFYGQHNPGRMPIRQSLREEWSALIKLGVLCSEMECASIYTVAASLGGRAGAVLCSLWNQERLAAGMDSGATLNHDIPSADRAIEICIEAIKDMVLAGETKM